MEKEELTKEVRTRYAGIAKQSDSCGCSGTQLTGKSSPCCGNSNTAASRDMSKNVGYSDTDVDSVPEGANLGLGCGNPVALASLKPGDVVLDLGSGAGFDCFLAAARVGAQGKVIGVDMTPEMLDKARENLRKGNYPNVEFRLGEIEHLPVADNSVNVIISNCVINLSQDKPAVFREAFRVLRPEGRLMVSDIVLLAELPAGVMNSIEAYVGCIAGASQKSDYLAAIRSAGFQEVKIVSETAFPLESMSDDPIVKDIIKEAQFTPAQLRQIASSVVSIKVSGLKK
jgi:arsenite methyltransferase